MLFARVIAGAIGALALLPAAAEATVVTVSTDDGTPVPLTADAPPITVRTMHIRIGRTVQLPEARAHRLRVLAPDGTPVNDTPEFCWIANTDLSAYPRYRGNGAYTVEVERYSTMNCNPGTQLPLLRFQYAIAAGVALAQPPGPLLTRDPNSTEAKRHEIGLNPNPGAAGHEVRVARGGIIDPATHTFSGPSRSVSVDASAGKAFAYFDAPGTYVFVGRAFRNSYPTDWSAPISVTVLAPFDLESLAFPDGRGPIYRLRGVVREDTASGRVAISAARGRNGTSYRPLGGARIGRKGVFSRRFRLRPGAYRLRLVYAGSGSVAAGTAEQVIRVRRRSVR